MGLEIVSLFIQTRPGTEYQVNVASLKAGDEFLYLCKMSDHWTLYKAVEASVHVGDGRYQVKVDAQLIPPAHTVTGGNIRRVIEGY